MDPKVILFDEPASALDHARPGNDREKPSTLMTSLAAGSMTMIVLYSRDGFAQRVADNVRL
jgi:ABC-type polar amino acid transport system ATPase subunit